jgi:hypothetical protein
LVVQSSYLLRCFIAIHEGHVAVHQDERILVRVVVLNRFLNLLESLLSVVSELTNFFSVWNAKDHKETVDDITIELFIITDENGCSV